MLSLDSLTIAAEPEEPMTVYIICSIRPSFSIAVNSGFSIRDLYIEVSAHTSLSRSYFKLIYDNKELVDGFRLITEKGLRDGSKVYLSGFMQSGLLSVNFTRLSKTRRAVRSYIFSLTPKEVADFFEAKFTLEIKIPIGEVVGTLTFKLEKPLPRDPVKYHQSVALYKKKGSHFPKKRHIDSNTVEGNFYGDLRPDVYNSKGVPGRTVDTIVSLMENLLDSAAQC